MENLDPPPKSSTCSPECRHGCWHLPCLGKKLPLQYGNQSWGKGRTLMELLGRQMRSAQHRGWEQHGKDVPDLKPCPGDEAQHAEGCHHL